MEAWLPTIVQPVLLVAGERDQPAVAASRALAARLPDARMTVIPDAGHLVNVVQPAAFNAAVETFLRDVR